MENTENEGQAFSRMLIALMKGILFEDVNKANWQALLQFQAKVRDYVKVLGLELMLDEAEGYAWLKSREEEEEGEALPRLVAKRQLTFHVSLLLALLRKRMAEFDASGGDTRFIMSRDEIVDMIRVYLPAGTNEVKIIDKINEHISKVVDLGFARELQGQSGQIEIRRILKAFVDAQWLSEFDERLNTYAKHITDKK